MATIKITSCLECGHHKIINDPDPNDWFCDDDKAIVCTKTSNDKMNVNSKYMADSSKYKAIAVSVRPYNLKKESNVPTWCPIKEK